MYFRPIQYLGAKTRTLDVITSECQRLYKKNTFVLDMFSGSSIVSQSIFSNGMDVIANDILQFCSDMSNSLLNVNKRKCSSELAKAGIAEAKKYCLNSELYATFEEYIVSEQEHLQTRNLQGLKELYDKIPQIGKPSSKTKQIQYIRGHLGESAIRNVPLVANYYAGTYFGIKQAIEIDILRNYIELFYEEKQDYWVYTTMLTALYSTLSTIVHSAGKHFAQPIAIDVTEDNKITNQRLFENRKFSVVELFSELLLKTISKSDENKICSGCISTCLDVQGIPFDDLMDTKEVSVVYADPPYTAQQYSRFYHIPEVVRSYRYPILQVHRGHITQGIYPNNRFKSDFCSKSRAIMGFEKIFEITRKKHANLILSYSESQNDKTGNERMVSKKEILMLAKKYLPECDVKQMGFGFDYKQLNSSSKKVENKEDKEFLLIFERK